MGCGAMMFAVWPYVIAHMKPNRDRSKFTVELNTQLMALLIGEGEEDIAKIIAQFCEPDLKSRTPDKEGRKLVKLGTYLYEVVNGSVYDEIRREAELRESNRRRQERHYYKNSTGSETPPKKEDQKPEAEVNPPRERFTKPTMEEVHLAAAKIGLSELEAAKFFSHYEANGWRVGKNPMKSWSYALSGWKMRLPEMNDSNSAAGPKPPSVFEMKTVLEAKEKAVQTLKNQHATETALGMEWDSDESMLRYKKLRVEIKQLAEKLAGRF